jgi:hypothetical protein
MVRSRRLGSLFNALCLHPRLGERATFRIVEGEVERRREVDSPFALLDGLGLSA